MWRATLEFWSLSDPNVRWVLFGSMLLTATAGVIGCFTVLRKRALAGDALAHAALPGVTTGFMLTGSRAPHVVLLGAWMSCLLGYVALELLTRHPRIREDSALAIVLSSFFSVGILQLTILQHSGGAHAGLDKVLFGQAASLVGDDVRVLSLLALCALAIVLLLFHRLKAVSFDRAFCAAAGISLWRYDLVLALITVAAVVVGLQLVGVVLMAAMLITPAAAARYWTDRLQYMLLLAALFGALSGAAGAYVSYLAPAMPTGPWIVVTVSVLFAASMLAAPRRGVVARMARNQAFVRRTQRENVLRALYRGGERSDGSGYCATPVPASNLLTWCALSARQLERALEELQRLELIEEHANGLALSARGAREAAQLTRRHRLWELYLAERINMPPDHVHDQADTVEHVVTGELEERLRRELDAPTTDPHGSSIPKKEQP